MVSKVTAIRISTLIFGLLITVQLSSQSYNQEVDFGARAGYSFTNYSELKRKDLPDGYDLSNHGYFAGLFMQLRVNHIYFQPEILYYHVSTAIVSPLSNSPTINGEIDMNFNSIKVPLVVGYRSGYKNSAFRIGAGVFFNFLLSTNGEYIESPGDAIDIPESFFESFNSLTFGARFNAGLDVGAFQFDISYQSGFGRLSEELDQLGIDFQELGKERTWIVSVGYKFIKSDRSTSY